MAQPLSFALLGILVLIMTTASAQDPIMPSCMSSCTTPFSANHEPDLCTPSWTSIISSCIDRVCSTTFPSSAPNSSLPIGTNVSMTVAPKVQYGCVQSYVPGFSDRPASAALLLNENICTESSYSFLSFLPTYTEHAVLAGCRLELYEQSGCSGGQTDMVLGDGTMRSGACVFKSGTSVRFACSRGGGNAASESDNTAAHDYLSWLCGTIATASPTAVSISTLSTATASVDLPAPSCAAGNSTCVLVTTNTTATHAPLITPAPAVAVEPDFSSGELPLQRRGAASWALIVVVFAGSVLL